MKFLGKLVVTFLANVVTVWITAHFLPNFLIAPGGVALATVAAVLTVLQTFIRPLIKLIFSPIIILTLGLFLLIINGTLLFLLDKFSSSLTINGLDTLFFATVITSAVNIVVHIIYRTLKIIV